MAALPAGCRNNGNCSSVVVATNSKFLIGLGNMEHSFQEVSAPFAIMWRFASKTAAKNSYKNDN